MLRRPPMGGGRGRRNNIQAKSAFLGIRSKKMPPYITYGGIVLSQVR